MAGKRPRFWNWRWWRVHRLRRLAWAVALFFVFYTGLLYGFEGWRHWLKGLLEAGGWPAFLGFTVLYNVLLVPFPYDPFLVAQVWVVEGESRIFWWELATIGVVFAAAIDVYLGDRIGHHLRPWLQRQHGFGRAERAIQKYGLLAIGLSAVLPIPFSLVCWLAGILGERRWALLLGMVAISRGIRHAVVLMAIG